MTDLDIANYALGSVSYTHLFLVREGKKDRSGQRWKRKPEYAYMYYRAYLSRYDDTGKNCGGGTIFQGTLQPVAGVCIDISSEIEARAAAKDGE